MNIEILDQQLQKTEEFFLRTASVLTEEHSGFRPAEDMWTTAQVIAHTAQTIDWFFEGAFRPEGFSMDWEAMGNEVTTFDSVDKAKAYFRDAIQRGREKIAQLSIEDLMIPLPAGPIMGGLPRLVIIGSIEDHNAHHRGALTVYARLQGLVAPMPYMAMDDMGDMA